MVFQVQNQVYYSTYQWYKDGAPIARPGTYWVLNAAQLNDAGDYHLVVSGDYGSITSAVMHLDVIATPPLIWQNPRNATVVSGEAYSQQAQVVGGPRPAIRWYHNGVLLPQETNQLLFFSPVTPSNAGEYFLTASNSLGMVTSSVATITVNPNLPVVWNGPTDQTAYHGANASFYLNVSGGWPFIYRWFHNGNLIRTLTNSPSLTLSNVVQTNAGPYFCIVSNYDGAVTSKVATLTVLSVPPVINGPDDTSVQLNGPLYWNFSIVNPPAFIRWFREGGEQLQSGMVTAPGNAVTLFSNVQSNQAGRYYIVASNQFGVSTSRLATLTVVYNPPVFTLSPASQAALEGTTLYVRFNFTAVPWADAYLYQNGVFRNTQPGFSHTPEGIFRIFTLPYTTMADSGEYYIVASNVVGMTTSAVAQITIQHPGPLDKWSIRNPVPQGRDLHAVTWGQNKFVTVGDNGAIVTSPDGSHWTVRNTQTSQRLSGIAYGNNRFVATTWGNSVLSSTDGENWSSGLVRSNVVLEGIGFGNGEFLAVGHENNVVSYTGWAFRSTNGVDWSPVFSRSSAFINFVRATYGEGQWLVVEETGQPHISWDLNEWHSEVTALVPYVNGMAYVNGNFFALSDNGFMNVSEDGISWIGAFHNGVAYRDLHGIAHGSGRYIVVGAKGHIITSSGDPSTWSPVASPTTDRLEDVVFANNKFVAVGENGTILLSTDGLNWFNQTRGPNHDLDGLAVANGLAVAVGKNGTILTSTDGTSWTQAEAAVLDVGLHGIAFGQDKWVAVGDSTNIFISTNGLDWSAHFPGFEFNYLKSVFYANNLWVTVGERGEILTSPDALTWTRRTSPVIYDLNEVTFGQGTFLIVGDHGSSPNATILSSPDGIIWTDRTYNSGKNARGVTNANDAFAMVNNDGLILYNTNITASAGFNSNLWTYSTTGFDLQDGKNLRSITWSHGLWMAVGNDGMILTATNIVSQPGVPAWRQRLSPTFENLHAVRYFNNTFIAIGNEGIIVQSGPLIPQLFASCESNILCVKFSSPYEGVYKLQETENLTTWTDLDWLTNVVGTVEKRLPMPSNNSTKKFYRAFRP